METISPFLHKIVKSHSPKTAITFVFAAWTTAQLKRML